MNFNNRLYGTLEKVKLSQLIHSFSTTSVLEKQLLKRRAKYQVTLKPSGNKEEVSRPWTYSEGSLRHCHKYNGNAIPPGNGPCKEINSNKDFISGSKDENTVKIGATSTSGQIRSVPPKRPNKTQNLVWLPRNASNLNKKNMADAQGTDNKSLSQNNEKFQKAESTAFDQNLKAALPTSRKTCLSSVLHDRSSIAGDTSPASKATNLQEEKAKHKNDSQFKGSLGKNISQHSNTSSSLTLVKSAFELSKKKSEGREDSDLERKIIHRESMDKIQPRKVPQYIASKPETTPRNQQILKKQQIFSKMEQALNKETTNITSVESNGQGVYKNYSVGGSLSAQTIGNEILQAKMDIKTVSKLDREEEKGTEKDKVEVFIWPPLYSAKAGNKELQKQQATKLKHKIYTYSKNIDIKKKTESPVFFMGRVFSAMRKNVPNFTQTSIKVKPKPGGKPKKFISKAIPTIKPRFSMTAPTEKEKDKALAPLRKVPETSRVSKVNSVVSNPKYFIIQEFIEENKAKLRSTVKKLSENKKKELTTILKDEIDEWKKESAVQKNIHETKARLRKSVAERALSKQAMENKGYVVKRKKVKPPKIASNPIKKAQNDENSMATNTVKTMELDFESIGVTEIMTKKYQKTILKSMPAKSDRSKKTFKDVVIEKEKEKIREIFDQTVVPLMQNNMEVLLQRKETDGKEGAECNSIFNEQQVGGAKTNQTSSFGKQEHHTKFEEARPNKPRQTLDLPINNKKQLLRAGNRIVSNHNSDTKSSYTSYPSGCLKKPEVLLVDSLQNEVVNTKKEKESAKPPPIYIPLRDKTSTQPEKPEKIKRNVVEPPSKNPSVEKDVNNDFNPNSFSAIVKSSKLDNVKVQPCQMDPQQIGECSSLSNNDLTWNRSKHIDERHSIGEVLGSSSQGKSSEDQASSTDPIQTSESNHIDKNVEIPENGMDTEKSSSDFHEFVFNAKNDKIININEETAQNKLASNSNNSKAVRNYLSPLDEDHNLQWKTIESTEEQFSTPLDSKVNSMETVNASKVNQKGENKKESIEHVNPKEVIDVSQYANEIKTDITSEIIGTLNGAIKEVPQVKEIGHPNSRKLQDFSPKASLNRTFANIAPKNCLPLVSQSLSHSPSCINTTQVTHETDVTASKITQRNPPFTSSFCNDGQTQKCSSFLKPQCIQDSTKVLNNSVKEIASSHPIESFQKGDPKNPLKIEHKPNLQPVGKSLSVASDKQYERSNLTNRFEITEPQSESTERVNSGFSGILSKFFSDTRVGDKQSTFQPNLRALSNNETKINDVNRNVSDIALHSANNKIPQILFNNTGKTSTYETGRSTQLPLPKEVPENKTGFFGVIFDILKFTRNLKGNIISKKMSLQENIQQNVTTSDSKLEEQQPKTSDAFKEIKKAPNGSPSSVLFRKLNNHKEARIPENCKISIKPRVTRTKRSSEHFEETVEFSPLGDSAAKKKNTEEEPLFGESKAPRDIGENQTTTRHIIEEKLEQCPKMRKMKNDEMTETFEKTLKSETPKMILQMQKSNLIKEEHETIKTFHFDKMSEHPGIISNSAKVETKKNVSRESDNENLSNNIFGRTSFIQAEDPIKPVECESTSQEGSIQNHNRQPSSSSKTLKTKNKDVEELDTVRERLTITEILGNRKSEENMNVVGDPLLQALKNLCIQYEGAVGTYKTKNQAFSAKPELQLETKYSWKTPDIIHEWERSKSTFSNSPYTDPFLENKKKRAVSKSDFKINFFKQKIKLTGKKDKPWDHGDTRNSRLKSDKFIFPKKRKNQDIKSKQKIFHLKELPIKRRNRESQIFSDLYCTKDDILGLVQWDELTNRKQITNPESYWNNDSKDSDSEEVLSYIRNRT